MLKVLVVVGNYMSAPPGYVWYCRFLTGWMFAPVVVDVCLLAWDTGPLWLVWARNDGVMAMTYDAFGGHRLAEGGPGHRVPGGWTA